MPELTINANLEPFDDRRNGIEGQLSEVRWSERLVFVPRSSTATKALRGEKGMQKTTVAIASVLAVPIAASAVDVAFSGQC